MKILSYNISWSKQEKIDWLLGQKGIDAYVVQSVAMLITSQFLKATPSSGRANSTTRAWVLSALIITR